MTTYFDANNPEIVKLKDGIGVKVTSYLNGLHWTYNNSKGEILSVILHEASYGGKHGLFEIMPSWRKPSEQDGVKGFVTFEEVQAWIDELTLRGK